MDINGILTLIEFVNILRTNRTADKTKLEYCAVSMHLALPILPLETVSPMDSVIPVLLSLVISTRHH